MQAAILEASVGRRAPVVPLICIVNQVLGSLHWGADFSAQAVDSPPVVSTLLMALVGAVCSPHGDDHTALRAALPTRG